MKNKKVLFTVLGLAVIILACTIIAMIDQNRWGAVVDESDTGAKYTEKNSELGQIDWRLLLVNPENKIPEGYSVKLKELDGGHAVDSRVYADLQQMMDDCRAEGLSPLICSSYRSTETQQSLLDNEAAGFEAQGYSKEEAAKKAATQVAIPGTSEHQTGLAVDIVDINNQMLDESQEQTEVQQWLMKHSWEYGFVLRYPNGKSDITGIIYEPWHYRYVGKEHAEKMYNQNLCLEEYIEETDLV